MNEMTQDVENKPEVKESQRARINAFSVEMAALCNNYGIDIAGSDEMCGWIGISCREVPEDAPRREYGPFDAIFRGVDQDGTWTETNRDGAITGVTFEDYSGWGC